MNDEIKSLTFDHIWNLVELSNDVKFIEYRWVLKTKKKIIMINKKLARQHIHIKQKSLLKN